MYLWKYDSRQSISFFANNTQQPPFLKLKITYISQ